MKQNINRNAESLEQILSSGIIDDNLLDTDSLLNYTSNKLKENGFKISLQENSIFVKDYGFIIIITKRTRQLKRQSGDYVISYKPGNEPNNLFEFVKEIIPNKFSYFEGDNRNQFNDDVDTIIKGMVKLEKAFVEGDIGLIDSSKTIKSGAYAVDPVKPVNPPTPIPTKYPPRRDEQQPVKRQSDEKPEKSFKDLLDELLDKENTNSSRRTNMKGKSIKSGRLPEKVYYIVVNGSRQYYEDYDEADDNLETLRAIGRGKVSGVYTETDPDEIYELYEVGYIGNSRKPIKSSLVGQEVTVKIETLYNKIGENTEYGTIEYSKDDNSDWYDFYNESGDMACCDGETCKVINETDDYVELQSEDAENGITFMLSKDEFDKCAYDTYGGDVKKVQSSRKPIKSGKYIKSGTSNFVSNDGDFPLVVYIAETYRVDDETGEETDERDYDAEQWEYDDAYDFAKDLADEMDIPLSEGSYRRGLESSHYDMPYAVGITSGYYEGIQIQIQDNLYFDPEEIARDEGLLDEFEYAEDQADYDKVVKEVEEREISKWETKINEYLNKLCSDYGWMKLGVSARFSNGETWYTKIDNSRKPIKSGMSYEQALDEFTSMGKPWGDYWSMQFDWTAFVDGLVKDDIVDYEDARWWDNPCTPETFKEWKNS